MGIREKLETEISRIPGLKTKKATGGWARIIPGMLLFWSVILLLLPIMYAIRLLVASANVGRLLLNALLYMMGIATRIGPLSVLRFRMYQKSSRKRSAERHTSP